MPTVRVLSGGGREGEKENQGYLVLCNELRRDLCSNICLNVDQKEMAHLEEEVIITNAASIIL